MTKILSLADLRPGDLMFAPIGGAVGLGVGLGQLILGEGFRVGPLKIRHVGIVTRAAHVMESIGRVGTAADLPKLVQAMPGGAEEIFMTEDTHWTPEHAYVRLPEDYPGQGLIAAAMARLMVAEGVSYSPLSYAALAAWKFGIKADRLEKWINRRRPGNPDVGYVPVEAGVRAVPQLPCEAICSVLVDQAWTLAGKSVMQGVGRQCVTPGALAAKLLFDTPDVSWSFPRRLAQAL